MLNKSVFPSSGISFHGWFQKRLSECPWHSLYRSGLHNIFRLNNLVKHVAASWGSVQTMAVCADIHRAAFSTDLTRCRQTWRVCCRCCFTWRSLAISHFAECDFTLADIITQTSSDRISLLLMFLFLFCNSTWKRPDLLAAAFELRGKLRCFLLLLLQRAPSPADGCSLELWCCSWWFFFFVVFWAEERGLSSRKVIWKCGILFWLVTCLPLLSPSSSSASQRHACWDDVVLFDSNVPLGCRGRRFLCHRADTAAYCLSSNLNHKELQDTLLVFILQLFSAVASCSFLILIVLHSKKKKSERKKNMKWQMWRLNRRV